VSARHLTSGHQSTPSPTGAHRGQTADRKVVKPTPPELMEGTGTGLDYGTRPDLIPGYLVPNGVRLRDLLEPAGLAPGAREVMPESLDEIRARRPMPLAKARADDTLVALAMNGEILPADHGFPARMVVSGWLGAASIKWLTRIEVSQQPLYVPWNTEDYVLIGPRYPSDGPARGPAITSLPVSALTELPWPARLRAEPQMIRGRAFAGEHPIALVEYRIDDGSWRPAELGSPDIPGAWVRWQFPWTPEPGDHVLRVRATDTCGSTQPGRSQWNKLGYLQRSVLAHPVHVAPAPARGSLAAVQCVFHGVGACQGPAVRAGRIECLAAQA
jgi:Oxidoreductase molybdopterin binding domain